MQQGATSDTKKRQRNNEDEIPLSGVTSAGLPTFEIGFSLKVTSLQAIPSQSLPSNILEVTQDVIASVPFKQPFVCHMLRLSTTVPVSLVFPPSSPFPTVTITVTNAYLWGTEATYSLPESVTMNTPQTTSLTAKCAVDNTFNTQLQPCNGFFIFGCVDAFHGELQTACLSNTPLKKNTGQGQAMAVAEFFPCGEVGGTYGVWQEPLDVAELQPDRCVAFVKKEFVGKLALGGTNIIKVLSGDVPYYAIPFVRGAMQQGITVGHVLLSYESQGVGGSVKVRVVSNIELSVGSRDWYTGRYVYVATIITASQTYESALSSLSIWWEWFPNVKTVVYTALSGNSIYCTGAAKCVAPCGLSDTSYYSVKPLMIESPADAIESANDANSLKGESVRIKSQMISCRK